MAVTAGVFFSFSNNTEAFGTGSTHPFLTKQIANLYNKIYSPKLTDEQIKQMVEGAVDEDTTPRWINHFYDPTTGDGLLGKRLGDLQSEEIVAFIKVIFNEIPDSTLDWVHNQELQQNSYAFFEGNRTFESAALSYADGDKNEAYYKLGYILHALEDMAVPAHTRQDSHFDMKLPDVLQNILPIKLDKGEPYEKWAESYARYNPADLVEKLKKDYKPLCDSLDDCLKTLAEYSNSNFFSSDTILDEDYESPKVSKVEDKKTNNKIISYYYDKNNNLLFKRELDEATEELGPEIVDSPEINQAYWDKLASKAVLAGVEVVRYFQIQAEKARKGEITINRVSETINPIEDFKNFSPYAQLVLMYDEGKTSVQNFWDKMRNFPGDFASRVADMYSEGKVSIQDFWHKLTNFGNDIASKFNDLLEGLGIRALTSSTMPNFATQESDLGSNSAPTSDVGETTLINYTGTGGPNPDLMTDTERQDLLDDIAEQLDIIAQQIRELQQKRQQQNPDQTPDTNNSADNNNQNNQNNQSNNQNTNNNSGGGNNNSGGGGAGGSSVSYPKILISEAQTAGATDSKEEFLELYNPNSSDVDLTSWYLQRKTATGSSYSTFAPNTLFSGKRIGAKGYFVIARTGYFSSAADISVDNPITDDNSFVLKNPNGEVSDKLGFGNAQDYESAPALNPEAGKSIGRKVLPDATEQDTDNNLTDFELQTSTPKSRNTAYVVPPAPPGPPPPPPPPTDTTAPEATFTLDAIQNSLSFAINFTITDPLATVSPSGIDSYVFHWQEQGGSWQEDAPAIVSGRPTSADITRDFTGEDEKTYYFQVKAKDVAGNESDWLPESPAFTKISIPKKVLINEVQVAGLTDEKEEFVELYNPGLLDIDLTGWYVQRKTKTGDSYGTFAPSALFAGKKIKSKAYFLIGREGSSFAPASDIATTYALTPDNTLVIKNSSGDVIDKAGWGEANDFETTPAASPDDGQSIQRKWDTAALVFQDTDNNLLDFEKQTSTPKSASPKISIQDATNYETCMGGAAPGTTIYILKIKWQSSVAGAVFDAQYKLNDADWKNWFSDTTKTEEIFRAPYFLLNDDIYQFRARAKDTDGNIGDWAEIEISIVNPVVINEAAFFGTNSSRDDQWLELYNRSDKDINLTGWKILKFVDTQGWRKIIELSGAISAKGYFFLERNDDSVVSDISANQIFTENIGSAGLRLINGKNRLIDEYGPKIHGWSEDDSKRGANYYSLERISPYSWGFGSEHAANWKINDGVVISGHDRDGNPIYGTPGNQNSVYQIYTYYCTDIIESTVFKKELSPFILGCIVRVFKGVTLTIESGVTMKFQDNRMGLLVDGTLKAIGTETEPIIFTTTEPNTRVPGHWLGIQFAKTSAGSELEYIDIGYAGLFYAGRDFGVAIKVDQSSISLKNSFIHDNDNSGLWLVNSNSVIDGVKFLNHNTTTPGLPPGSVAKTIYIEGGTPEIKNSRIESGFFGIYLDKWTSPSGDIYPMPNLHTDFLDPEKNTFMDNPAGDIFYVNPP